MVAAAALFVLVPRFRSPAQRFAIVTRGEVARALVLTGRVRTLERPRVGANVPGTIREVLVREGDRVRPGQLLARIHDAEALAGVAEARAALVLARARAGAGEEQAAQAVRQAERDLERLRSLHAAGAVSAREVEVAERGLADARSALEAARARDGSAAPLAETARARAALAAAEARLADARVTAPAAGVVLTREVEPGDAVTPGQVLFELALDGPTELSADAREENLASLVPGAPAVASADAFPDSVFAARVLSLSPVVDPAQGTVEVRFAVPDPPAYLRPGMTVSINVVAARRDGALLLPPDAVESAGRDSGWVTLRQQGRTARRAVRIGIRGDQAVEILDGVAEGDSVVLGS